MRSANKLVSLLVCSQTTGYVATPLLYAMLLIYSLAVDICHAMHLGDGVSNAPRRRRERRGPNFNTNFNSHLLARCCNYTPTWRPRNTTIPRPRDAPRPRHMTIPLSGDVLTPRSDAHTLFPRDSRGCKGGTAVGEDPVSISSNISSSTLRYPSDLKMSPETGRPFLLHCISSLS